MASSSSSRYSVFLSFRGTDTRRTFVAHLHKALTDRGIVTFKDDTKIKTGEPFPHRILEAIQDSIFAIVVLSENFASSKWCLIELRTIMELWSRNKIQVFPIFYGVEPSEVRKEEGSFWKLLERHTRDPFVEEVPKWKEALTEVSFLNGKDSTKFKDDAAMVKDIVNDISIRLSSMLPIDFADVVGMNRHMKTLDFMLNIGKEKEVRMIGISGMGGIGKTTIAKYLFNQYSGEFPAHCFIENAWEISRTSGLVGLQEKFVSSILLEEHVRLSTVEHGQHHIQARLGHRRVLVVLDGVDRVDQIRALAKKPSMFGLGSRIIITTRDRSLLRRCGVHILYEVECLQSDDSLLMFKRVAFGGGTPPSDVYEQLSVQASQLAYGLPFALEAFGLCFRGKTTTAEWEDELRRLETTPHENTMEILKISCNDLPTSDKELFLHIACLFNGDSVLRVKALLDNFEFGIEVLSEKSLINISIDGYLKMHALVEQAGRQIVRQEAKYRSHKQLILWDPREICNVLAHNSGTDQTQCLALHMCEMHRKLIIGCNNFRPLYNLRILKFYKHLDDIESKLQLISEDHLLPFELELRMLQWDAYPFTTLPFSLHLECLVELKFRYSNLERLWDGAPELVNLTRLELTGSKNLRNFPDISKAKKLEDLLLDGCMRLDQFPRYIGTLSSLGKLHAVQCDVLQSLRIEIMAATTVSESSILPCPQLRLKFSSDTEPLQFLTNLSIEGKIFFGLQQLEGDADHFSFNLQRQIPYKLMMRPRPPSVMSSFHDLTRMEIKRGNYNEDGLPFRCHSFLDFPLLVELNLINLQIEDIPSSIGELQALEKLNLGGNDFKKLPRTIQQLSKLKYLNLHNCCKLEALPPLTQVETLIVSNCINLQSLLEFPTRQDDQSIYHLLELELDNCNNVQSLSHQLSHFTSLKELNLGRHNFETAPASIKELSSLITLSVNNCKELKSLEELPLSLKCLYAHGCYTLEHVSLSHDHCLEDIDLDHCFHLKLDIRLSTWFQIPTKWPNPKVQSECGCCVQETEMPELYTQKVIQHERRAI